MQANKNIDYDNNNNSNISIDDENNNDIIMILFSLGCFNLMFNSKKP